jgi:hypothetical protein
MLQALVILFAISSQMVVERWLARRA